MAANYSVLRRVAQHAYPLHFPETLNRYRNVGHGQD
jgi:hypothetical protein